VHVKSVHDMEFLQAEAAALEDARDGPHLWVVLCSPAAASVCRLHDSFLSTLAAVHLVSPQHYSEIDALALLSLCDKQLVTDALSWWAAYLSPRSRPRTVLRELWDRVDETGVVQEGEEYEIEASLGFALGGSYTPTSRSDEGKR